MDRYRLGDRGIAHVGNWGSLIPARTRTRSRIGAESDRDPKLIRVASFGLVRLGR